MNVSIFDLPFLICRYVLFPTTFKKLSSCSNGNDIPLPAETSEGHNSFSKLTVNILAWKILAMTIEVTFIITIE